MIGYVTVGVANSNVHVILNVARPSDRRYPCQCYSIRTLFRPTDPTLSSLLQMASMRRTLQLTSSYVWLTYAYS